ncbi:BgTH12-06131 [Blumeria graminis f. sp. triticale]|uniref:Bgt-51525 n=2 Tax=Blumeria graminis TaxID=34373 RepID=A0A9X9QEN7_BLUGR|nr:BgTH12-06131 [Blumeria graminis f. sp. triticale]VDB91239.1 Bgt-51525 [Blumeria graminis f. sp. tritici]
MHFSNIAIILQCAALFVLTLAIYKLSHANEMDKKFKCHNRVIEVCVGITTVWLHDRS